MLGYCLQEPKYDESYDTIGRQTEDCVLSAVMAVAQTPSNLIHLADDNDLTQLRTDSG